MSSIKTVVNEAISDHEEYHMVVSHQETRITEPDLVACHISWCCRHIMFQAFQLGPTEASRYWVYWVPAQYVDAIKDVVLGKW